MQEGKNWILPKETMSTGSHCLKIWKNNLCPSMGPNGGSVALDTEIDCFLFTDPLPLPVKVAQHHNAPSSFW